MLFVARYYYWWDRPRSGMLHLAMSPLGLMARGHDVRFVCERRFGQRFDEDGVDVRWFETTRHLEPDRLYASPFLKRHAWIRSGLVRTAHLAYLAGALRTATTTCRDWQPDVVYCQAEAPAPAAHAIARQTGAKLVIHAYGGGTFTAEDAASRVWRASRMLDVVYAYRCHADAYLVVDDGTGGAGLATMLGAPAGRIHHWSIPVALPSLPASPSPRSVLGIPETASVVIAAARMVPIKRMDLCVDAIIQAARVDSSIHGILVGDGPVREDLEKRVAVEPATIADRVHFVGHLDRDRFSQMLQASDIFLSLQDVSVSGTNLRDAMVHGMCIVTVKRPSDQSVASLIRNGETGVLLEEADLPQTSTRLVHLARDKSERTRLGTGAAALARSTFQTWDERIDAEERLLLDLTGRS